jgi:hypothetical protein
MMKKNIAGKMSFYLIIAILLAKIARLTRALWRQKYLYQELVRSVDVLLCVEAGRVVGHGILAPISSNFMATV